MVCEGSITQGGPRGTFNAHGPICQQAVEIAEKKEAFCYVRQGKCPLKKAKLVVSGFSCKALSKQNNAIRDGPAQFKALTLEDLKPSTATSSKAKPANPKATAKAKAKTKAKVSENVSIKTFKATVTIAVDVEAELVVMENLDTLTEGGDDDDKQNQKVNGPHVPMGCSFPWAPHFSTSLARGCATGMTIRRGSIWVGP